MTISDLIQVILMGLLVVVTGVYAWRTFAISTATKKQADASVKMAEEMRDARFAALRPSVVIAWIGSSEEDITVSFKNSGLGPALNLNCYLTHDKFSFEFKHGGYTKMEVEEKHSISFPTENFDFQEWAKLAINCDYQSIYGESFRSILRFEAEEERHFEILEIKEGQK